MEASMTTIYHQQPKTIIPCNKDAIPQVRKVLQYLCDVTGKGILLGQHTQTMPQEELKLIKEKTGKLPAICGFELLSYSPGINFEQCNAECLEEIVQNQGTLSKAWDWVELGGLVTFTWHWFSPLYGHDKSFYAENTKFRPSQALIEGTPEYIALLSDLDHMAGLLKPFCERNVPILWRPFHEADGKWFWWGIEGIEPASRLYRMMYDRFTNVHHLNNLIWVWNTPNKEFYPGNDVVDIISRDLYPKAHTHTDLSSEYEELVSITDMPKLAALAEIGSQPDVAQIAANRIPWTWYMVWSNEFLLSEKWTSFEQLQANYADAYAITLDKLPYLYQH